MVRALVAATLLAVFCVSGPARGAIPVDGNDWGALTDDRGVAVWSSHGRTASGQVTGAAARRVRTLTSYRPVCTTAAEEALGSGRCRQANAMCSDGASVPMCVLTAPARPRPGADDWVNTGRVVCRGEGEAEDERPVVVSAAQFRRLPIPAAGIRAQPDPAVRPTLVNVRTNLMTTRRTPTLTTTVLGQPVRVRATPARYHWNYGDGTARTTTEPGAAYPAAMPTAHVYRAPGRFTVTLTTTFTGEYSVAGGPWLPVDGTAEIASDSLTVEAIEARAELVG